MTRIITLFILLAICICGCNQKAPQKKVDWKVEWQLNEIKLKKLINEIKLDNSNFYKTGRNKYPKGFVYPFHETFFLARKDTMIVAIFYLEKNNMNSISTFTYTNDSTKVIEMNRLSDSLDSNKKLDHNWYFIKQE